jgi:hypothetical protein
MVEFPQQLLAWAVAGTVPEAALTGAIGARRAALFVAFATGQNG